MAESQDQSVLVSAKCDGTRSNHQETRGELTLQSISGTKDQFDTKVLEIIAEHLKKLQAAIAAHPQASERTSYHEKENKVHEALTAANGIISEMLGLMELPRSLSPEKLTDLVNGLTSTMETPDVDVDHVNIHSSVRSTLRRPWWKASQKKDGGIKATLKLIVSLAALIQMNADSEKRSLQDLQRITEEKRQAKSELEWRAKN